MIHDYNRDQRSEILYHCNIDSWPDLIHDLNIDS